MAKKFHIPPYLMAEDFFQTHCSDLRVINNKTYWYKKPLYEEASKLELKNMFVNFMGEKLRGTETQDITEGYIKSALMCLNAFCSNQSIRANLSSMLSEDRSNTTYIPVGNGILTIYKAQDEYRVKLSDYSSEFFTTNQIKTNYNPKRIAKRFRKLLTEIAPVKEERDFLQEFMGYSLTRDTTHNIMAYIFGPGANGKSAFLTSMMATFGIDCYSSLSLSDLQGRERYTLSQIKSKFLNLCDEIPEDKKISTDRIKNITSGGRITTRNIYEAPQSFAVTTKLLFCSNSLPRFTDKSDAIYRRMCVVSFPNQFLDPTKQDKRLLDQDYWINSGETEGILNWALEGLIRLKERGHFIEPSYSKEAKNQLRLEENPEREFVLDNYVFTGKSGNKISTYDIYKKYEAHCGDYGIPKKPNSVLGTEIRRVFPKVEKTGPLMLKKVGKKFRFYIGISKKEQHSTQKLQAVKMSGSTGAKSSIGVNNEQ